MTLNTSRWIVRLFFWSVGILDAFTDGSRRWTVETRGTNLCFFFQVTFVWVPLILLLHVLVYGGALAAFIVAPIYFFGAGTYAAVLGAIATLAALIGGAVLFGGWRRDRRYEREVTQASGPSSLGIVWQWAVAQKQKVCPMISFTTSTGARV